MWYTFAQNNSGGVFDTHEERGIGEFVLIEADSATEANERAEDIGLYFDGGDDCPCCGDRWYREYFDDRGTPEPEIYGTPVDRYTHWAATEAYLHPKSGPVEKVVISS